MVNIHRASQLQTLARGSINQQIAVTSVTIVGILAAVVIDLDGRDVVRDGNSQRCRGRA